MARAYVEGRSLKEAGALHGFSALACRTALQKLGVLRRTRSQAQRVSRLRGRPALATDGQGDE
jgi:hypothetical protein